MRKQALHRLSHAELLHGRASVRPPVLLGINLWPAIAISLAMWAVIGGAVYAGIRLLG